MRGGVVMAAFLAGMAGTLVAAWPGVSLAGDLDGQTVRVCTWGGPWKKVQEDFIVGGDKGLAARGAKVEFVTGSPQDNMAKLIAARGKPVCDVIEILDANWDDMVKGDLLQKVDRSRVPNAKDIPAWQVTDLRTGSWFTQEGICYNAARFAEAGIPEPKTYKDLVHPKLEGRVQLADITSGGGLAMFGGIIRAAGGTEKNAGPGLQVIKDMKVRKFWKSGAEPVTLMESGDIWAAVMHGGWCMRARKSGQKDVKFVHPVIDTNTVGVTKHGFLGIVKGSDAKSSAAVHAFIDAYLSPEVQYQMSISNGTVPVNSKAYTKLAEDAVLKEMLIIDPAKIDRMLRINYADVVISDWNDQWNRSVTQ
jgi:putative spermidine/putrescine transport system substrate-binding protein